MGKNDQERTPRYLILRIVWGFMSLNSQNNCSSGYILTDSKGAESFPWIASNTINRKRYNQKNWGFGGAVVVNSQKCFLK